MNEELGFGHWVMVEAKGDLQLLLHQVEQLLLICILPSLKLVWMLFRY
jgi:hypothetical protein